MIFTNFFNEFWCVFLYTYITVKKKRNQINNHAAENVESEHYRLVEIQLNNQPDVKANYTGMKTI